MTALSDEQLTQLLEDRSHFVGANSIYKEAKENYKQLR